MTRRSGGGYNFQVMPLEPSRSALAPDKWLYTSIVEGAVDNRDTVGQNHLQLPTSCGVRLLEGYLIFTQADTGSNPVPRTSMPVV